MFRCPKCNEELENNKCFWCGYEYQERGPLWVPSPFDNKECGMMPFIFNEDGWDFSFHSGEVLEKNKPSHVHIEGHGKYMEVWLFPIKTKYKPRNIKNHVENSILKITERNLDKIMTKWEEYKRRAGM